ncbi:FAD-dependent monooxygenase [Tropicimonas isoalkanivorans]|uniref:Salicylate hydroxylase n=1 Tax=Tropicimonas isoalkanivorans TaxID=441112 RepID=A0A1I1LM66_9RHOB|nr:FAD-dependent monooxygenase [Tropicimonas isoalkanivorans]SFC71403.1 salicylate hydroxylase [Tropicimonas isoalkanivorans]
MNLIGQEMTILGAGIAGLAAARALAMRGARVRVLEQAPAITEVGAGLQISPNGAVVLEALGLGAEFEQISMESEGAVLRDYVRGAEVLRLDLRKYGRFGLVHRADLIRMLEIAALEVGVEIELGTHVASVHLNGVRPVLFIDGRDAERVDFLVAADGLHSRLRTALLGDESPQFTGQVAWRALLPILPGQVPVEAQVFMGRGRHLVAYPLRSGTVLNIVGVMEAQEWTADGWNHPGDPSIMRAHFAEFGGPVRGWLERLDEVMVWGLFRHGVASQWHGSNAVLIGDAAHPTLPFLAQGACMALEDAWVLAETLVGSDTTGAALDRFEAARKPRTRRIVDAATANARNYHLRSGPIRGLAHLGLRAMGSAAPDFMPERFRWLYGHDVTQPEGG